MNTSITKPPLAGKTVVITGATSGVGRATAEAFAHERANVVIVARGQQGIEQTIAVCEQIGATAIGVTADVSSAKDVRRVAQEALKINGRIDIWVNNAGVMASGKFEEIPMEIHEGVIKTNLFGYMHGAYEALRIFKSQDHGILINNVSIGGFMPAPFSAVYSSTKFGIRGMMECLQGEISNHKNIHICNLYPQLQNSTGNLHSAKYSGFDMKISALASDPRDTAAKILAMAQSPKKDQFPDFTAAAMTGMYRLFPKTIINSASAVVRWKMDGSDSPDNPGNVLEPSKEPLRVYGNRESPSTSRNFGLALLAGLGIGIGAVVLSKKWS